MEVKDSYVQYSAVTAQLINLFQHRCPIIYYYRADLRETKTDI